MFRFKNVVPINITWELWKPVEWERSSSGVNKNMAKVHLWYNGSILAIFQLNLSSSFNMMEIQSYAQVSKHPNFNTFSFTLLSRVIRARARGSIYGSPRTTDPYYTLYQPKPNCRTVMILDYSTRL